MTLPALIHDYQIFVNVQRLKSVYSVLAQAIKESEFSNGDIALWDFVSLSNKQIAEKYLIPYLKVIKTCDSDDSCFVEKYKYPNKQNFSTINQYYSFVLNNGVIVGLKRPGVHNRQDSVSVIVDVNGSSKPNTSGYDLFFFNINTKNSGCSETDTNLSPGFYPSNAGCSIDMLRYASGSSCNTFYNGMACAALLMSVGWNYKGAYVKGYNYGLY